MIEKVINRITDELKQCSFISGIVLGGSRATGTASESSDIDIGIYYYKETANFTQLNEIASKLDDTHREGLICKEGGWGNWVNCGGWLIVDGFHVDLILREISRVEECIAQTEQGIVSQHYQPGHPHAYLNVMYRGELAVSKLLYARETDFLNMKEKAETYPDKLQNALISFFLFEAKFSCDLAENYSKDQDVYYVIGHLFRAASAMNQVLFAANRMYCLNEKKATKRIESFSICPENYRSRINQILSLTSDTLSEHIDAMKQMYVQIERLVYR